MTTDEIRSFLNRIRQNRGGLARFAKHSGLKANTLLKIANSDVNEPGHTIAQKIISAASDFEWRSDNA